MPRLFRPELSIPEIPHRPITHFSMMVRGKINRDNPYTHRSFYLDVARTLFPGSNRMESMTSLECFGHSKARQNEAGLGLIEVPTVIKKITCLYYMEYFHRWISRIFGEAGTTCVVVVDTHYAHSLPDGEDRNFTPGPEIFGSECIAEMIDEMGGVVIPVTSDTLQARVETGLRDLLKGTHPLERLVG